MSKENLIIIDQSTQGTKVMLFDINGNILKRIDKPHKQIVNEKGWISHNPEEIYDNVIYCIKSLLKLRDVDKNNIVAVGISNQRETSLAWNKKTGKTYGDAIVWQCSRSKDICRELDKDIIKNTIENKTGLKLSPYFPASKFSWIEKNRLRNLEEKKDIIFGTIDSWLIYNLTNKKEFKTDYSNASRTQLFNIKELKWDKELCEIFNIDINSLPEVCNSNEFFGETDFDGLLNRKIPIHGVLGDSHGALFGQECLERGMVKATYGTGSSIMMNIGNTPTLSKHGLVTSIGWGIDNKITYVLEGNINYTGAVITWLKDELELINSPIETEEISNNAVRDDALYIVPAFTGLGAPYWKSDAIGIIYGITRTTTKKELVRSSLESIGYQIADVLEVMEDDSKINIVELRVDGGPTKNKYLMQFQSDILNTDVLVPNTEELSGIGVAYMVGITLKLYDNTIFSRISRDKYNPTLTEEEIFIKRKGWKNAVEKSFM